MRSSAKNEFMPDYATHPGEILEETLEARNMKKTEFAKRCGLSVKTVSQIINGKAPVTAETAIQFERVLGVSSNIWNNLQAMYDLHVAQIADQRELQRQIEWERKFPVNELVRRGHIDRSKNRIDTVRKLLDFFGVGSINAWNERFEKVAVACRQSPSFKSKPESVAAWLRIGEVVAEDIGCEPYNLENFKQTLKQIKSLTGQEPSTFVPETKNLCAEAGVALVLVPELPGTRLSGATRWLTKDKALIMLSLRYKTNDHFWFTFFHEAGHIVRDGKKEMFLDDKKNTEPNAKEEKGNSFAEKMLIPKAEFKAFIGQRQFTSTDIRNFAKRIEIAPGIVVGRLQHEGSIGYNSIQNSLKEKFQFMMPSN